MSGHIHNKHDFSIGVILGMGAYGKVCRAVVTNEASPRFSEVFAIKILDKSQLIRYDKVKYAQIEKQVFVMCGDHPNICTLHFSFHDREHLYYVIDFAGKGILLDLLDLMERIDEDMTRIYMAQIVSALEYMHSKKVYHRDVKPENMLVHEDGHLILTDFGTAKIDQASPQNEEKEDDGRSRSQSFVGSPMYVPPELLVDELEKCEGMDFWGLGCVIYQCLVGHPPFQGETQFLIFEAIKAHVIEYPDYLSDNAKSIIDGLLTVDVNTRLGMNGWDEIKNHPFFEGIPWDWTELNDVPLPFVPPTPKGVRDVRAESAWDEIGKDEGNVTPLTTVSPVASTPSTAPASPSAEDSLQQQWKGFLRDGELVAIGAEAERTEWMGFVTKRRILLLTDTARILEVDLGTRTVKREANLADVTYEVGFQDLTFVFGKRTLKYRLLDSRGQLWQEAIERVRR